MPTLHRSYDAIVALVLASSSPRRLELLNRQGLDPEVAPADIDETPGPGEAAAALVVRLARQKAETVGARRNTGGGDTRGGDTAPALVLAADTVVVVDGEILGKPGDDETSDGMLRRLSGRSHEVLTGVAVTDGRRTETALARTEVEFRTLADDVVAAYVATGEGRDKAGAYGIQGRGALLVEQVHGPYDNVVGLPIVTVDRLLARFGTSVLALAGSVG